MAKIAISLPDDVLRDVEKERQASGETRSQFFRRAVKDLLKRQREREATDQYVPAYREMPETEAELGWVEATSQAVLEEYPWNDETK